MLRFSITLLSTLLLVWLTMPPTGLFAASDDPDDHVKVDFDKRSQRTRVTIPAPRGRISWGDLLHAIALARGDEDEPAPSVKGPTLKLHHPATRWVIRGINVAMGSDLQLRVERPTQRADPQLVVTLDRQALLSSRRRLERRLRDSVLPRIKLGKRREYGLHLDDNWRESPLDQPLVISVHGLYSKGARMERLTEGARELGMPTGRFEYSSRLPLDESCRQLSSELADVAKKQPKRKITLIGFSMGGLVARGAIEDPQLDPGNVRQLIMIATPNYGSRLAEFNFGLSFWRYASDKRRRDDVESSTAALEDALAGASVDLRPHSEFLTKLNSRPRNPKVRYSLILGNHGFLKAEELERLVGDHTARGRRGLYWRFFGDQLKTKLLGLEEVIRGRGDGAVALKRGRLEGVEDTIVLSFRHSDVWRASSPREVDKIFDEVSKRLRQRPREF